MAASSSLLDWLRLMRLSLGAMTVIVNDITANGTDSSLMRAALSKLHDAHSELYDISTISELVQDAASSPSRLRAEHTLLVADFSSLLNALVPQLRRLGTRLSPAPATAESRVRAAITGACSVGTPEEEVFWELWNFLFSSCSAASTATQQLSHIWPGDVRPFHAPLFADYHSLLVWLLSISRSPAWLAMEPHHGMGSRNHELFVILTQATKFLEQVYWALGPDLARQLRLLPASYVPLLCCIVCEQLGSSPPLVPPPTPASLLGVSATSYTASLHYKYPPVASSISYLLRALAMAINNFLSIADRSNGFGGPFAFLRSTSVLQFLKIILVLPDNDPTSRPNLSHCGTTCLHSLLRLQLDETQACLGPPLSSSDGADNRDAWGLPIHSDPLLSLAAVETDAQLLHALSTRSVWGGDAEMATKRNATAVLVVQLWTLAGRLYPVPAASLSVMTRSIQGLAKLCAWQGLQQLLKSRPGLQCDGLQQQQAKQDAGRLTFAKLVALGVEGVREIRNMTYLTSNFQMYNQRGCLSHKAGPSYDILNAWSAMPGWAATTEVVQRGEYPADDLSEITSLALSANKSLSLIVGTNSISLLRERISLAATVRKLIWPYLQRDRRGPAKGRRRLAMSGQCEQQNWGDEQRRTFHMTQIAHLVPTLLNGILCLNYVMDDSSNYVTGSTSSTSSGNWILERTRTNSGGGGRSQPIENYPSLSAFLLQRLQVISLVTLVQACMWRSENEGLSFGAVQPGTPDWFAKVLEVCKHLHDQDMRVVVRDLLGDSARPAVKSQAFISAVWERYAVTHLQGRLLPGCCNLGCSNLQGFSESTLETQLCSGCRRARYCSNKCQREAWQQGGHSSLCGIQSVALS